MKKILVYGATGSQSHPVVQKLVEAGFETYALTRSPQKAVGLERLGAKPVLGDMEAMASLRKASEGMDGVFLLLPAFTDRPMNLPQYGMNAIDAAKEAGVKLIVWNSSGQIPEEGADPLGIDARRKVLHHLEESGVPYVVLQPTGYMENLLGPWTTPRVQAENVLQYPTPRAFKTQWIATVDVAALAAAAFQHPPTTSINLKVAGPERLDGDEMAASFSRGLGREVRYEALSPAAFGEILGGLFGAEAGAAATKGYEAIEKNPELFSPTVDMAAVLEKLPVKLTTLEAWVRAHTHAFAPKAEVTA